jgi:hypothetical protein
VHYNGVCEIFYFSGRYTDKRNEAHGMEVTLPWMATETRAYDERLHRCLRDPSTKYSDHDAGTTALAVPGLRWRPDTAPVPPLRRLKFFFLSLPAMAAWQRLNRLG